MNKAFLVSVIYFVIVLLIGIFNIELRITEGYLFILVLAIINLSVWSYLKINQNKFA